MARRARRPSSVTSSRLQGSKTSSTRTRATPSSRSSRASTSSRSTSVQGQAIEVKVSPTATSSPSTATERTSPRSTMPTPSSGSSTSASAARTPSTVTMSGGPLIHRGATARLQVGTRYLGSGLALEPPGPPAAQLAVAALQHADELLVARAAALPAGQHVVPGDGAALEVPALALGVEAHREGAVDHVGAGLLVAVGGDREAEPLAQRHRRG